MKYHIGISGSHHESSVVVGGARKILFCFPGESLNLHTYPMEVVATRLGELFQKVIQRLKLAGITELHAATRRLCIALPGASSDQDYELAKKCLQESGWPQSSEVRIVDDTWAGLVAGAFATRGICTVAGTGASVYVGLGDFGRNKNQKLDGWGPVLGDFGSGFQLVVDFFRFLGRELDRNVVPPLFDRILAYEPKIQNINNVQQWFDSRHIVYPHDWKIRFAQIASVITSAAEGPNADPTAVRLIEQAAAQIAETISIGLTRYKKEAAQLPIVLQGGMFEHSNLFRNTVIESIKSRFSNTIKMSQYRPVLGSLLLAMAENIHQLPDKRRMDALCKTITKLPTEQKSRLLYPQFQMVITRRQKR